MLGLWPILPIVIDDQELGNRYPLQFEEHVDNIVAALEHRDRVCQIGILNLSRSMLRIFTEMMQEPFPALTCLYLDSESEAPILLSDSFLGGSAPHLRSLTLANIPFPSLPILLLTTKELVQLRLWSVSDSGYISAAAMVICLSSLTRLEDLEIRFNFRSLPDGSNQRPSSLRCVDLPTLAHFNFLGTNEYIEELVATINAPLLQDIFVAFFDGPLQVFDTSKLNQFIGRAEKFKMFHRAVVEFDRGALPQFSLFEDPVKGATLQFMVSCTPPDQQLLSLAALSSSPSSPLRPSSFERLEIPNGFTSREYMKKIRWLELLQPFTSAKDLYLGSVVAPRITRMLRDFARISTAEVLPSLQHIFVQDSRKLEALLEFIGPFIAARQLFGRPVALHRWDELQKDDGGEEDDGVEEDEDEEEYDGEEDDVWVAF